MNSPQLNALKYIQNTGGNATLAHFHEDHEPVGPALWDLLLDQRLVHVDGAGKIGLTHGGLARLSLAAA